MNLSGKSILVTGGTDGIGAQLIRQLRVKGASVITQGRNPERVAATRADGFEVVEADLSTIDGITALLKAVKGRQIDVLVNNAGALVDHDFRVAAPDLAAADRTIFLNLNAPMHLIAGLVPGMRGREAMVVNVTSGLAIAPYAGGPVYCATKAGLRSYTMGLRAQFRGTGIHFLEVLPPVVATQMNAGRDVKKLPPEECARQMISAMERGANEANVGMVKLLRVVESLSPALARRIMIKF